MTGLFKDKAFNDKYFRYFGYSSIARPEDVVPNVAISFYSFHLMVVLGFLFILIFAVALFLLFKGTISTKQMVFMGGSSFYAFAICCRRAWMDSY